MVGSWKPDSLFQQLGKDIFEEIKELAKDSKYKFILSIHPNEYMDEARYKSQFPDNEPFGKYVDEMVNYNCIVRKPGEDFIPYLVASDLVICDYSSMSDNAIMCEKNIVYSEFGESELYELSSSMRLKKHLPILRKAEDLEKIISKEYNEEHKKRILEIKEEMYAPSGYYEKICIESVDKLLKK